MFHVHRYDISHPFVLCICVITHAFERTNAKTAIDLAILF
jgi:hypothetical protein